VKQSAAIIRQPVDVQAGNTVFFGVLSNHDLEMCYKWCDFQLQLFVHETNLFPLIGKHFCFVSHFS